MPYNSMPPDLFLRQFFSQLTPDYAQLVMLVGLLLVVIYRPERIYRPGMFRLSCALLAVSIVVNPIVSAVVKMMMSISSGGMGRSGNVGEFALLYSLLEVIEPFLVAASVFFGIFSLLPRSRDRIRSGPAQHPLDP